LSIRRAGGGQQGRRAHPSRRGFKKRRTPWGGGKGARAPLAQNAITARYCRTCFYACIRAHGPQSTTPSAASAAAPPPLPRKPLLILMLVARNAGRALCCEGRLRKRGGLTCRRHLQARSLRSEHHAPPLALALVIRPPTQTIQVPIWYYQITRVGRKKRRSAALAGALCPSAPFSKPRPPAEPPQAALPSQHCLMLQWHAFTLIWLVQKRQNYLCQLPNCLQKPQYKTNACALHVRPHSMGECIHTCFGRSAWTIWPQRLYCASADMSPYRGPSKQDPGPRLIHPTSHLLFLLKAAPDAQLWAAHAGQASRASLRLSSAIDQKPQST